MENLLSVAKLSEGEGCTYHNHSSQTNAPNSSNPQLNANTMKKLLLTLATLGTLSASALANGSVLVEYNWNNLTSDASANVPSFLSPCVTATNANLYGISDSFHASGGVGNSKFRCFSGWDKTNEFSFSRTNLNQYADTLAFDVTGKAGQIVEVTGISLDWNRPFSDSVNCLQASIFWVDNNGAVQYRTTGAQTLSGTGAWNALNLSFTSGSAALPTGLGAVGEKYHVELYAWGANGNIIYLDDIQLMGTCAPVPEPAGALLLGSAGFLALIRRRSRCR